MEVRGILQAIGMEATVLAFLFAIAFAAVRISLAGRQPRVKDEDTFVTISNDHQLF